MAVTAWSRVSRRSGSHDTRHPSGSSSAWCRGGVAGHFHVGDAQAHRVRLPSAGWAGAAAAGTVSAGAMLPGTSRPWSTAHDRHSRGPSGEVGGLVAST